MRRDPPLERLPDLHLKCEGIHVDSLTSWLIDVKVIVVGAQDHVARDAETYGSSGQPSGAGARVRIRVDRPPMESQDGAAASALGRGGSMPVRDMRDGRSRGVIGGNGHGDREGDGDEE